LLLTLLIIPLSLLGDDGRDNMRLHLANNVTSDVYFFTQFRVLVMYLRLLFFPVQQSLIYDFPVSQSFFEVKVVLSFLLLMAIFFFGVVLFIRSRTGHPELRIGAFGIFWFFITHAVESSIIPLQYEIFEYRLYPSVLGYGVLISYLCFKLIKNKTILILILI